MLLLGRAKLLCKSRARLSQDSPPEQVDMYIYILPPPPPSLEGPASPARSQQSDSGVTGTASHPLIHHSNPLLPPYRETAEKRKRRDFLGAGGGIISFVPSSGSAWQILSEVGNLFYIS